LAGSGQSYCKNKQAYFLAHPVNWLCYLYWHIYLRCFIYIYVQRIWAQPRPRSFIRRPQYQVSLKSTQFYQGFKMHYYIFTLRALQCFLVW